MNLSNQNVTKRFAQTDFGTVAYTDHGEGPVVLFIHGVLVNSYLWRHQINAFSSIRRCIAIDLMGHGDSIAADDAELTFESQAEMVAQLIDVLGIDEIDLIANDSGVGIASIFAARYPEKLRTLVLSNGDVHDNWPPKEFSGFLDMVAAGGLPETLQRMVTHKDFFRSEEAFGPAYQNPEMVEDSTVDAYIGPIAVSEERTKALARFILSFDHKQTVRIESSLRKLNVPTLIIWGTGDIFFDKKWAYWLADAIPAAEQPIELEGACLLLPEERWSEFNDAVSQFWASQPA